jgi:glycosyltransferase involved in cell wall biosynthesis
MRISVVTPCFNMANYLEQTIASVLQNLRPGDEYFIIDGGSTDGSVDVIRGYQANLTGWISEADHGYADALAKGFARASGDILCWINASDMYLSGALDAARALLTDDLDLIFGDDFYIDENNKILSFSRGWVPNLQMAMLYGGWSPLQDACFWRRSLYEKIGGIDRSLRFAADYDLFLRMALIGRSAYVSRAFSAFRRHVGQKSISGLSEYQMERRRVRQREMAAHKVSPLHRAGRAAVTRVLTSARARLGPLIWRRSDLAGRLVTELRSDAYWPALAS